MGHASPRRDQIDRYVLLHQLGEGGAGIVYAAYDIELRRKVALKLMRRDLPWNSTASARKRLVAEARAIARLSHPNVVEVFDVLVVDDELVIAMELVDGPTLAAWLCATARRWPEIVDVLADAGRGLAAAHAVGIVHRDFKPGNVLVGADGRVRVVDFGVAHQLDGAARRDGELAGTAGYIAPEQARGEIGPAADQFSFCVTAWFALHGRLPFEGTNVDDRLQAAAAGRFADLPPDRGVPSWLHAILVRGLRADPHQRFADMNALLHALGRARRPKRVAVVAAVGAGVLLVAGATRLLARSEEPCSHGAERIANAWNVDREASVRAAFEATSSPSASATADRVVDRLDRWAETWTSAYTQACEAGRTRDDGAAALLDARVACLSRRLSELGALVSVLESADAALVDRAVEAVTGARDASDCLRETIPDEAAPPPEAAERVAAVREQLATVSALNAAARYEDGLALAEAALVEALDVGHEPLLAEALFWRGASRTHRGHFEDALEDLTAAMYTAEAAGSDAIAFDIAVRRAELLGEDLSRTQDGLAETRRAEAILERIDGTPLQRATLENTLGVILHAAGRNGEALPRFQSALALRLETLGPDDPVVVRSINNVGIVLQESGEFDRAAAEHERALEAGIRAFGPMHRTVGRSLNNLGNSLMSLGENARALETIDRAIDVCTASLGDDHPDVAMAHINRGNVLSAMGRPSEARAAWMHALAIFERRGDTDHPTVGAILNNLGRVALDSGDHEQALQLFARAVDRWEASMGPEHATLGYPLTNIGRTHNLRGEHAQARAPLERALVLRERGSVPPVELATTRFELARALGPDIAQRERAIALAEDARAAFAELDAPADVTAVEAWLAAMRNAAPPDP